MLLALQDAPCGLARLAGHDFLKNLGVSLIPATAPDFFLEETPTGGATFPDPEHRANVGFGDADKKTLYIAARTGIYRIRVNTPGI
jgi:hypothetical protein